MTDDQPRDPLSFASAQALFRQTLQARNASPRTVRAYADDVTQFVTCLKAEIDLDRVDEVQREDVEAFLAHLGASGAAGTSRRRKLCAVRHFFVCLADHGHIAHDPTHGVANPKAEEHTPQILFRHEYKALLYEAWGNPSPLQQAYLCVGWVFVRQQFWLSGSAHAIAQRQAAMTLTTAGHVW